MLRILVFTEDSGKYAHATVVALVEKMLRLVDKHYQRGRLSFEPPEEADALVARANFWRSTSPEHFRQRVSLVRSIATKVAEETGFVFFHIDGDCPWSQRETSQTRRQFEEHIVDKVRNLLSAKRPDWTPEEIERRTARLCVLVPFYSIEAWVYQNTEHAIALCRKHYRGKDVERFEEWQAYRERIDEVTQVKEAVCIKSKHNLELARNAFPYREACGAGTSLAAAVETLRSCPDLHAALARTWEA